MEVTLTDAGTVWSETGPSTIYLVSVKAPTGKNVTVASGDIGYIELVTTENSATVRRYFKIDATLAAVTFTTTTVDIGSFYTENTPSSEKAYVYNATFETAP